MKIEFTAENDDIRLSEELKLHLSRKLYKHVKGYACPVYVNGELTETYKMVHKGDTILIIYNNEKEIEWDIYESKVDIYYEDENYLVVFKRAGLLTIPTKADPKSLYQELLYYFDSKGYDRTVSILNRLDRETEGLVLIAKNPIAASKLQPTHKHMTRKYIALCHGIFDKKKDHIEIGLLKNGDQYKREVSPEGQISVTNYQVIEEINGNSLVEFVLETGRTHQIRVTSSYLGHPLVGDSLYGDDKDIQLHLTSYYLSFIHPYTGKLIEIESKNHTWSL